MAELPELNGKELHVFTVHELRTMCENRSIDGSGSKSDLIHRLLGRPEDERPSLRHKARTPPGSPQPPGSPGLTASTHPPASPQLSDSPQTVASPQPPASPLPPASPMPDLVLEPSQGLAFPPPAAYPPGTIVRLTGIKALPELNGQQVKCGAWDGAKGRIQVHLSSGEVKNVRVENLEKVMPTPKRARPGTPPASPRTGKNGTSPASPAVGKSPLKSPNVSRKKNDESPWALPKMDFDEKENLDEEDAFRRDVFMAVKKHIENNPDRWTASMMREDIANENDWDNDTHLVNVVKAAIHKLGFTSLGATGGGSLKVLEPSVRIGVS